MTTADWSYADMALLADVYELECKSRMNVLYYGKRLGRLQAISFGMEVVIAATASGSGLAAIALVKTQPGQWLWQTLALTAAVVSVIRPHLCPWQKDGFNATTTRLPREFLRVNEACHQHPSGRVDDHRSPATLRHILRSPC